MTADSLLQIFAVTGIVINTGILTRIYFKLGAYDEKHKSHNRRLDQLEEKVYV